jgi:hypothetical protein
MTGSSGDRRLFAGVLVVALALCSVNLAGTPAFRHELLHALTCGRLSIEAESGGERFDRAWVATPPPAAWAATGACPPAEVLHRGHIYEGQAPGVSFALLPFYMVGERLLSPTLLESLLVVLCGPLPLAAFAVATRRSLTRAAGVAPERAHDLAALAALGTLALPYETRFMLDGPPVALLALSLATLLRRPGVDGRERPALAGLLAASAVCVHHGAALAAAALLLLAARRRGTIPFLLGALPVALILGAYDTACFGRPWSTGYDHRTDAYIRDFMARGVKGYVVPDLRVLVSILVGRRGFLETQPLALVGLLGLVANARREPMSRFALGVAALVLIGNAARAGDWHGGWSLGARYTLPALPFVVLGLPRGLTLLGRAARPLAAVSVFLAWVGATIEWTYVGSFLGNVRAFLILGPRARALQAIVLGVPPTSVTRSTALLAALLLSVAFPLAHRVIGPRTRLRALTPLLALAPWLASIPYHFRLALEGPAAVHQAFRASYAAEARAFVEGTTDVRDLRDLTPLADLIEDRALRERILEKIAALDRDRPAR